MKQPVQMCKFINENLAEVNLFGDDQRKLNTVQNSTFRISPQPFTIDIDTYNVLNNLGPLLYKFYQGINNLYDLSVRGHLPNWIHLYLDAGKTELVLNYGRMRRFKQDIPLIIRPDIILTDNGLSISELDSVPGGFGLLAALSEQYAELGWELVGGNDGIIKGFSNIIRSLTDKPNPILAIIVSQESSDYLGEMQWTASALNKHGLLSFTTAPEDIIFKENGLFVEKNNQLYQIDVVYRFFELFDLKNIPKIDLILYAIRKQLVVVTPPIKSYLEEKMLFALFHHPGLKDYWISQLGESGFHQLKKVFPSTWILDNRPVPPYATIPNLNIAENPVTDWNQLKTMTKSQRELVIKISGFSELAWGSRGVSIGHDMSKADWAEVIDNALDSFPNNPYILQRFMKGRQVSAEYYDFEENKLKNMRGRVRLCPYYMIYDDKVHLTGALATICPLNKKIIHGMVDSIMIPTSLAEE